MKEFVNSIDGDENMLAFAADHMDADENDLVEILIVGNQVAYSMVKEVNHTLAMEWEERNGERYVRRAKCSCGTWTLAFDRYGPRAAADKIEEAWKTHL